MRIYTMGYGGRSPTEFVARLAESGVASVVDVRIEPRRASLGSFALAKTPDKGIQRLLAGAGIAYVPMTELGNVFRGDPDWKARFDRWFRENADDRLKLLEPVPAPFCLVCAEKDPARCHRQTIADALVERGHEVTHL